eukprot:7008688-Pyramimonas_sp.AAC.1
MDMAPGAGDAAMERLAGDAKRWVLRSDNANREWACSEAEEEGRHKTAPAWCVRRRGSKEGPTGGLEGGIQGVYGGCRVHHDIASVSATFWRPSFPAIAREANQPAQACL